MRIWSRNTPFLFAFFELNSVFFPKTSIETERLLLFNTISEFYVLLVAKIKIVFQWVLDQFFNSQISVSASLYTIAHFWAKRIIYTSFFEYIFMMSSRKEKLLACLGFVSYLNYVQKYHIGMSW